MLDGETKFFIASAIANFLARNQRIPKMIVVGIPNTARNRDFTPADGDQMQNSGGAENFTNFLSEELLPIINNNYRTYDYNILFGHSLCGMYSIYTMFDNPEIFDAYIAASPWLMFNDEYVIRYAKEKYKILDLNNKRLFISLGEEPRYFDSLNKLTNLLSNNDDGLNWVYNKYDKEDHGSIPFRTISDGLAYIYSDWPLTNEIALGGVDAIKDHFSNRLEKYGFSSKITEVAMNIIGYQLLQADEIDKAIEVFKYNVEMYPRSSNVYDSLGDAYDTKGSKKKALKNYKKAVQLGELEDNPNLSIYQNNVDRLEKVK